MTLKRKKAKINLKLQPEMNPKIIPVTRPQMPPLDEFIPYLRKIWNNQWLTNNGPYHQLLEAELASFLGVKHVSLFANGTIALVTALQALGIKGEVITTPYSFVATTHALSWNNLKPVFADIDPTTFNLDPDKAEAAITSRTSAILPVHCYGRPCDVERFEKIGKKHKIKIIYDAAHAFGVSRKGKSLARFGDLSVLSFHATKVFNTFEGGAIVSPDTKTKHYIDRLKNFGYVDEVTVANVGINGKMNEVQAAFGLLQLQHFEKAVHQRKQIDTRYRKEISRIEGITCPPPVGEASYNYAYFPILVGNNYRLSREKLYQSLRQQGIFARRYFYPLISSFPMYRGLSSASPKNIPVAANLSERVLCLPIYPDLTEEEQNRVINTIQGGD